MPSVPKIYIDRINNNYLTNIQEGLEFINMAGKVKSGDTVFIKPNLTYPYYKKGVMTSLKCIEAMILALKDYSVNVIVGEADSGGYNRFSMNEVFEKTGLRLIAEKQNVKLVNLSELTSRDINFTYKMKDFSIPLPILLLDEVRLSITLPVPKIHMHTGISMSIKNQWGCIQDPSLRLKLHPYFQKVILEVNKACKVAATVVDGKCGLNRSGPLEGDPVELGWLMVADNILAADYLGSTLVGIDPRSIGYLRFFHDNQPIPPLTKFNFNRDFQELLGPHFYLRRKWTDYPGYLAFRSPLLAYLAYNSPLAGILHKMLYLFRDKFYEHE
jgi:uncharacterized protein (DUF362 family)